MRSKLKIFTDFANSLLPHETQYLLAIQQMADPIKLNILQQIDENCHSFQQPRPYDESIDKRKYSHLKAWISKQLQAIDVDQDFAWMIELERKISWDIISPAEEKELLKAIRHYAHPRFHFIKFYEVIRLYRQFLLIRLRYADHQLVDDFLQQYKLSYEHAMLVNEQLHQASKDIIRHYAENTQESIQWEKWLTDTFYDEKLDGLNRYMALIRLIFIAFNYNKYGQIQQMFQYLSKAFGEGKYYSKRILLNYYNNRLLLHTRLGELEQGVYYGHLSIRRKNHDYLFYVNNLCNVLLQMGQVSESWHILREALPSLKSTHNYHSRIGFVALYMKTLIMMGEYEKARAYGEINLNAYKKEILRYRWHRFFSTYLECLLLLKRYTEVTGIVRKYRLVEKERRYKSRSNYLPTIAWYTSMARYQHGDLSFEELIQEFESNLQEEIANKRAIYMNLMERLKTGFPELNQQLMAIFD